MMTDALCRWCRSTIRASRRRGSPAQFCSEAHRHAFWASLRAWAWASFEAGEVTIDRLRHCPSSVHASSMYPEKDGAP